ncbi:MAG: diguanylate cyclase [Chloroflexi bacterium]|nr:diguanylate cyclase [Chloroflexota bacterium]
MAEEKRDTILVVDDAPENVILLTRILKNAGYGVATANHGGQALELAGQMLPDLALMDIDMPVLDGYEACRRLKADEQTRGIPVIFISALDTVDDKVRAFQAGGVDYISKPFYLEEVLARVKAHLSIRHLNEQLQFANHELAMRVEELTDSQEQLQEHESKLMAFVNALPNLSFVYDEDGRYLEILANEASLLRLKAEDMLGRLINDVMPVPEAKLMMDAIRRTIETGQTQIIEYKIPVLAGGERWFEGRIAIMEKAQKDEKKKVVFIATDISERIKLYQEAHRLATQDPLTGCFNRRHFLTVAAQELQRTTRYGQHLSMLMLDIDHFKEFNDSFGHPTGDKALTELVRLCQTHLRTTDVLGRYGGEEFIILLPEIDGEKASQAGNRLRGEISKLGIETSVGKHSITVSVGAASFDRTRDPTLDIDALIHRADRALYAAKSAGRNCVKLWADEATR